MSCQDCDLHKKCKNSLLWGRGSHPRKTEVMVIQEAPTFAEDRFNATLSGDIRGKLNYFFEKSGIDYTKVFFTSALKCAPKKTSEIKKKHLDECHKYLFTEILEHKPKVIIAMGRWAWQAVSKFTAVREFRGHFDTFELDYEDTVNGKDLVRNFSCKVMPTFSLMASLRKWEYNDDIIRDFTKVQKYVTTGKIDRTPDPKYNTILTKTGINDFVEKYREMDIVTTDFETTGFHHYKDRIINGGYCGIEDFVDILYLAPYKKEHIKKWDKENVERAKEINAFLKYNQRGVLKAMQTVHAFEHIKWVLHNGKFDAKFANAIGAPYFNFWFDTLMADPLIDENLGHSLNIAMERRGINYGAYDTKLWKYTNKDENKKKSYQYIPPHMIEFYLAVDCAGDRRLLMKQIRELKEEGMWDHMFERKMPILKERLASEYVGVKMDRDLIHRSSKVVAKAQDQLFVKLTEITKNEDFNPNSPKQIIAYMDQAGYPFKKLKIKENATGFSTAKDELEKFLKYKKWKEFPQLLLNHKKLAKIKGTYIDGKDGTGGMLQYLDQKDRVHANYNLWTPRTSRQSCNKPSLQVWPRPIKGLPNTRNYIVPTNRDWCLFEADYSQIEQCVVAALSKDRVLTKRIQDGIDLHCINAADLGRVLKTVPSWVTYEHMLVMNDKADKINDEKFVKELLRQAELDGKGINWKEKRTQAKNIGFGLNYGKTTMTFAEDFGISLDESEEMVDAYFEVYSGMKQWRDDLVESALNKGYVELTSGRKRRFGAAVDWIDSEHSDKIWSAKMLREEISRQAMNYPVQGGAHEVFEPAIIRLDNRFRKDDMLARLLLLIHDGTLGECPITERRLIEKLIKEEMTHTFHKGTEFEIILQLDVDFYTWDWYGEKIKI